MARDGAAVTVTTIRITTTTAARDTVMETTITAMIIIAVDMEAMAATITRDTEITVNTTTTIHKNVVINYLSYKKVIM
jgi:hypothetical protein